MQVVLGAHSLSQPEPSKRRYDVLRAVPHPGSRPDTIDHDLLLLKVSRVQPHAPPPASPDPRPPSPQASRTPSCGTAPARARPDARFRPVPQLSEKAQLGPAVQPLPWQREDRDVEAGTLCDVAGWGVVSYAGRRPDRLQYLPLRVMARATCNRRTYHDGTITERMMCGESNRRDTCAVRRGRGPEGAGRGPEVGPGAGVVGGACGPCPRGRGWTEVRTGAEERKGGGRGVRGRSAHGPPPQGDSGGPLVCGGVAEAVVTSGSRVCGNPKKPGIYTRLASYADWIDGVLAEGAAA